jgi:3-hydroxyisobutyrate dehydrogenase-like beta-hydroxyacid dehydrogenase
MPEYFDRICERRYDPAGFALEAGLKDLNLISDAAFERAGGSSSGSAHSRQTDRRGHHRFRWK